MCLTTTSAFPSICTSKIQPSVAGCRTVRFKTVENSNTNCLHFRVSLPDQTVTADLHYDTANSPEMWYLPTRPHGITLEIQYPSQTLSSISQISRIKTGYIWPDSGEDL